jgi:hypothetical protein
LPSALRSFKSAKSIHSKNPTILCWHLRNSSAWDGNSSYHRCFQVLPTPSHHMKRVGRELLGTTQIVFPWNERHSICHNLPTMRSSYMTGKGQEVGGMDVVRSYNWHKAKIIVSVAQIIALVVICLLSLCVVWQAFGLIIFGVGGHTGPKSMKKEGVGEGGRKGGNSPISKTERDSL